MNFSKKSGFTLIEVILASLIVSMVLLVAQGLLTYATRLRNRTTEHVQQARLRSWVAGMIRNDLDNALVSGGTMAASMVSFPQGMESRFPGYLRFTATQPKKMGGQLYGDIQEIKYFIVESLANEKNQQGGQLVREIDRHLLATFRGVDRRDVILDHVVSLEASFYDGTNWANSWDNTDGSLPKAIRVIIHQAALTEANMPPSPIEIFVPWNTEPFRPVPGSSTNTTTSIRPSDGALTAMRGKP